MKTCVAFVSATNPGIEHQSIVRARVVCFDLSDNRIQQVCVMIRASRTSRGGRRALLVIKVGPVFA
jgi:hypothetical protein